MSKLHELLAVEGNLENQANKCRTELMNTFEKKRHLFEEKSIVFQPLGESEKPTVESQSDIQSSVTKELEWISGFIAKSLDASYQVAEANTLARADVILEDKTILLKGIPATSLLELEKRVNDIHQLVNSIPTLDPAKGFTLDKDKGKGIYKAREVVKPRTKKTAKVLIKYEATPQHPAQTELVHEDVVTGKIQEQEWSSLITPADKAELLNRVEILQRAVRRARSRANEQVVDQTKTIGSTLLKFVINGQVPN